MNRVDEFEAPAAGDAFKKVGSDRVNISANRVLIDAAQPMDWAISEFCRTPVYFEGRKYYLRSRHAASPPFARQYELCPWPADLHEESSRAVIYSEAYVAERDARARRERRGDLFHTLLLPFYPFLGLCWSQFKNSALSRLGFEPRSITSASLILMLNLLVLEGIFVGWLRTGIMVWVCRDIGFRDLDWALMVLVAVDTLLRYNQSMNLDLQRHWGFCEWLWPRRATAN